MRKAIVVIAVAVFMLGPCIFLWSNSKSYVDLMRLLNKDTVYLQDWDSVDGWIWDEKDGIIVGQGVGNEIFVFNKGEYLMIERNPLLRYLRGLI